MKFFRSTIVFAIGIVSLACGQAAPTNVKNTAAEAPRPASQSADVVTNTTVSSNGQMKRPSQAAAAAAAIDDELVDLYATNCMICHKDTGKGGKVTIEGKTLRSADLTSARFKKLSDDELLRMISDGEPDEGMPSFKGKLSDDEIKAVIKEVRALQSK